MALENWLFMLFECLFDSSSSIPDTFLTITKLLKRLKYQNVEDLKLCFSFNTMSTLYFRCTFALRLVLTKRVKPCHTSLASPGILGFHVQSSKRKKWLIPPAGWKTTALQLPPKFRHQPSRLSRNTQEERLPRAGHVQPRWQMEESAKTTKGKIKYRKKNKKKKSYLLCQSFDEDDDEQEVLNENENIGLPPSQLWTILIHVRWLSVT